MTRVLVIVALVLALGALQYGFWVVVRRRFVEVIRGWCFQSGAMPPERLLWFCHRYGIRTVFDFRGARDAGVAEEAAALAATEVRYVNIPCGREPTEEATRTFLERADLERAAGRRVLLHCKDGQGRAIYFAAVALLEYTGCTPVDAYHAVRRLPPSLRWIRWLVPRAGLLGRRNPKYRLIMGYRPVSRSTPA